MKKPEPIFVCPESGLIWAEAVPVAPTREGKPPQSYEIRTQFRGL